MNSVETYFYHECYQWKFPELLFRQCLDCRNLQELWWAVVDKGGHLLSGDVVGREYLLWTQQFCVVSQFRRRREEQS